MKVRVEETTEWSDEQLSMLADLIDEKQSARLALRAEAREYLWAHGSEWDTALDDDWNNTFASEDDTDEDEALDSDDLIGGDEDDEDEDLIGGDDEDDEDDEDATAINPLDDLI